jgi:Ca2+-binding EF-hand superfamily protein
MKLTLTLAALFVSASLAIAAEGDKPKKPGEGKAGDGKRPNPEEIFKKLDANSDGSVSKDEYMAGPRAKQDPAKAGEGFSRLDKDSDGKLSKEEFAAAMKGKGDRKTDAK